MLDATVKSKPYRYVTLDKSLLYGIKSPTLIKCTVETYSVGIGEGALMLIDEFKEFTNSINFLLQLERDFKIYRCLKIDYTYYLETLPKRKLVFLNPDEKYYAVK